MAHPKLKNKPLVEAILEVRWSLEAQMPGDGVDPHYKLLLGRFYDRVREDYPEHEQLPTASVPDEMVGHLVQHRFRTAADRWPLVQLGPGIMTVNSTDDYTWESFRPRALLAIQKLFDSHPKPADLKVEHLALRHIDAVPFDYASEDVVTFLREKLKIGVSFPENLFAKSGVQERPSTFRLRSSFRSQNPPGLVHLSFATGQRKEASALVWETTVETTDKDVPELPKGFADWIDAAHSVTGDWFFKLIEGELERRFFGDKDSGDAVQQRA